MCVCSEENSCFHPFIPLWRFLTTVVLVKAFITSWTFWLLSGVLTVSFPMRVSSRYTQHIVVVTCVQYTHFIIVVTCGSWVCRFQSGGLLWTPIGIALGGADSFFFHICMCQIILCFILHVIELFCLAGPICHRTRKLKIRQQVPLDSPLYIHTWVLSFYVLVYMYVYTWYLGFFRLHQSAMLQAHISNHSLH